MIYYEHLKLKSVLRYMCAVFETGFCKKEISKVAIFPSKQRYREEKSLKFEEYL